MARNLVFNLERVVKLKESLISDFYREVIHYSKAAKWNRLSKIKGEGFMVLPVFYPVNHPKKKM